MVSFFKVKARGQAGERMTGNVTHEQSFTAKFRVQVRSLRHIVGAIRELRLPCGPDKSLREGGEPDAPRRL